MYDVFSLNNFSFPKDFLWGSGVAGHQVEGMNIYSNLWNMEQEWLVTNPAHDVSGMACNHYNLYKEDTLLLKKLGHKAFRLSVEWSRIEPSEGTFIQKEVDHYIDELMFLKENGIQVFCTLVHFTIPLWFEKSGGFGKLENRKYFERYLNYILPKISPYVDFWNVFNEFNLGGYSQDRIAFKLNSILYHALGYHLIKKYSDKPVSTAHAFVQYMPTRPNDIFDKTLTQYCDLLDHEFFFHAIRTGEIVFPFQDVLYDADIKNTIDYWSINIYTRDMIDARKADSHGNRYKHKVLKMLPEKFYLEEMYPECMIANLTRLTDKPVYISENGCSCDDDRFRIVYIALYLSALSEAINLGVDVRGYLYWSTMDNYEWGRYFPKFGLCGVDRESFKRTIKPSGYFYKEIIENNGFNQNILRKYLNELPILRG